AGWSGPSWIVRASWWPRPRGLRSAWVSPRRPASSRAPASARRPCSPIPRSRGRPPTPPSAAPRGPSSRWASRSRASSSMARSAGRSCCSPRVRSAPWCSLGLAHLAGRRFTGRLRRLMGAFSAFGRGETVPELPVFHLAELAGVSGALGEAMALMQTRTAELRESEQRYRTLFERNPAGMALSLADGRIVDCNEALARMLGFEHPADMLAANASEFYAEPKEREQLLERVKSEGAAVNVELQFRRRDGQLIWVLANVISGSRPGGAYFEATLID